MKTRAVQDGDEWIVTGQKVWTSGAQYSKWCMLVARTDTEAPEAQGAHLLPDGHGAGRACRSGRCARSPASPSSTSCSSTARAFRTRTCSAATGNGWKVALTTLMNERAGLGFFLQVRLRQLLDRLIERGRRARACSRTPWSPTVSASCTCAPRSLRLTAYRGLTAIEKYGQPGPEGSLTKWMWSDTNQQLTQLAADLLGPARCERATAGPTSCCARAATRSRGARPRCSRTSSPSACSACPKAR